MVMQSFGGSFILVRKTLELRKYTGEQKVINDKKVAARKFFSTRVAYEAARPSLRRYALVGQTGQKNG